MKRMHRISSVLVALGIITAAAGIVSAEHFWKIDIAAPASSINSRTFNLEYTVLSTEAGDKFTVELLRNGSTISSESTIKPFGDSGDFKVTVPSDGMYTFVMRATAAGGEVKTSAAKQVYVDTVSTGAPSYGGKTRTGNTYTITFTAPNTNDVTQVRVFSSATQTFRADDSTQVGVVSVNPGQTASITYTAPDNRERFHAVQAFDAAGNGSQLVGDPSISVTQGVSLGANGGTQLAGADVAGAASGHNGQVNASGDSSDINTNAADLLSSGDAAKNKGTKASDTWIAWAILIALVAVSLGYANREKLVAMINRLRGGTS